MNTAFIPTGEELEFKEFTVHINRANYGCFGMSLLDGLSSSIDAHIELDKEFTDYITITSKGEQIKIYYAPALLCGLGYLSHEELLELLIEYTAHKETLDADTE